MSTEIAIGKIKPNKKNPRLIKDEKFEKLVQSIIDFPQMLHLREVVVDENMVVLGGNMRLSACKKAGLKKVPYKMFTKEMAIAMNEQADKDGRPIKTYEQYCDEFIVKDNASFGEWNWDMVIDQYGEDMIMEWGVDLPEYENPHLIQSKEDDEWEGMPDFETPDKPYKMIVIADTEEELTEFCQKHQLEITSKSNSHAWYMYYPNNEKDDVKSVRYE